MALPGPISCEADRTRGRRTLKFMNASEFETRLRELLSKPAQAAENPSSIACEQCQRCALCTFCKASTGLVRCHYCVQCRDSTDCSHCVSCINCLGCKHCVSSERCTDCAYVVRSYALASCTYCFGCVGLQNKDFHVLNQPYSRSDYFALTRKLAHELRLPTG